MRVISNFHDYYDSAQAYGHDTTIVYQRKMVEYPNIGNAPPVIRELHKRARKSNREAENIFSWISRGSLASVLNSKKVRYDVGSGRVVFCGKNYMYYKFTYVNTGEITPTETYFYTLDSMIDFCDKNGINIDEGVDKWTRSTSKQIITESFANVSKIDVNWLIENKVICAKISKNEVVINPQLKPLQFFRAVGPYEAYGELDMWICGTLAYPQNEMVMLDDKSMIAKHGFDKWSFRKMPEK